MKDWESRLDAVLVEWRHREHRLGASDCGAFLGAAIEAITGDNPVAWLAGRYTTRLGWLRAIRRHGWADLPAAGSSFGPEIAPLLARRGDVGFDGDVLGIVITDGMLRMVETGGLLLVPRRGILRTWALR